MERLSKAWRMTISQGRKEKPSIGQKVMMFVVMMMKKINWRKWEKSKRKAKDSFSRLTYCNLYFDLKFFLGKQVVNYDFEGPMTNPFTISLNFCFTLSKFVGFIGLIVLVNVNTTLCKILCDCFVTHFQVDFIFIWLKWLCKVNLLTIS